ncbi:pilus assembly PilX N-terminal domain-containing protein [Shewanella submarina]|uniref:PilX N-terminal domain-containing pilus assembly protein n=1 Tax=Shewanella submarina TaxID=2016376 RepID=A0ABV7G5K0_9GAMM|nr:pilus assembly PilX N-terminal domain-containing protein [Shewanella submarina]MCL1038490.1 pilus assembly PilX N-terminal domain-containing protein [Shewanella submarina]
MQNNQQGAVLAIGLVFLLIITVIGVAGSGHSLLGERMAGNNKQIAEAFMAAETGIVNAVSWLDNPDNEASWGQVDTSLNAINALSAAPESGNPAVWQIANLAFVDDEATILSCGSINGSGVSRCISSTYIKGSGGGNLAAMNIIGKIKTFDTANSNQFQLIGGNDGPALATDTLDNAELIIQDIESKGRMDNYVGGVKEVQFDDPFGDPQKMQEFITGIKDQWAGMLSTDPKKGTVTPLNMGDTTSPKITYHEGDVELKGSGAVGAGILVIDGNLSISGNFFDYDGLVVVTGQSFSLSGGGSKDARGSIVFANPIQIGDSWAFGEAEATFEFDVSGGGNATFTYDEQVLSTARDLLSETNIAKELWQVDASESVAAGKSKVTSWSANTNDVVDPTRQ